MGACHAARRMPALSNGAASTELAAPEPRRDADVATLQSVLYSSVGILAPLAASCPCFGVRRGGAASEATSLQLADAPAQDEISSKLWKDPSMGPRKRRNHRVQPDDSITLTFGHARSDKVRLSARPVGALCSTVGLFLQFWNVLGAFANACCPPVPLCPCKLEQGTEQWLASQP